MSGKKFSITDKWGRHEYLGIHLEYSGKIMRMSQPHLINRIIGAIPVSCVDNG